MNDMNSYLERLRRELEDATAGVGASEMAKAPAGKWCGAQILEHLFLTYKMTNRGLEKCLERGVPLARHSTAKDRLATLLVLTFQYIPGGRTAPERVIPRGIPAGDAQQAIGPELERMESHLRECEQRFGSRTKIMDHVFIGPLTADEWRKFHWVHGRHHARQIRERVGKS
jgi:hypothetical protein